MILRYINSRLTFTLAIAEDDRSRVISSIAPPVPTARQRRPVSPGVVTSCCHRPINCHYLQLVVQFVQNVALKN